MALGRMKQNSGEETNRKRAAGTRLTVLARQLWQRFDRSVTEFGVSRAQWRLIAVVAARPGATQRLVGELLEVSEVTAGRLIDRLCDEGYLRRQESATDRRARCVYLTDAAQPVLERMSELARIEEDEAFAGFSEQDLDKLEGLLDRISRNVAMARAAPAKTLPPESQKKQQAREALHGDAASA
jgi:DNA-binding MarR family transcriptional regulator